MNAGNVFSLLCLYVIMAIVLVFLRRQVGNVGSESDDAVRLPPAFRILWGKPNGCNVYHIRTISVQVLCWLLTVMVTLYEVKMLPWDMAMDIFWIVGLVIGLSIEAFRYMRKKFR
jgi:hypothetical protein